MKLKNKLVLLIISLFMISCSSSNIKSHSDLNKQKNLYNLKEEISEDLNVLYGEDDPLADINKRIYYFNGMADRYVLKPTIINYKYYTPNFFQKGIHNFFMNFKNISTALNSFLQLKFKEGFETVLRFGINSTIGILGIFDPASTLNIPQYNQTFGRTLAYYGVPTGTYIVAPLLGPSNVRDLTAFATNSYFINSLDIYHPIGINFSKWYLTGSQAISTKIDTGIFFLETDHVFEYEYIRLIVKKYLEFQEKQNRN